MSEPFALRDLGRLGYLEAWDEQRRTHAAVVAGEASPTLLLVEHPPTVTFGRKGGRENLLVREDFLLERGFTLHDIERGGDVTYHGPGQLVGYPVFRVGRNVQRYLRRLEGALVALLAEYDVEAVGSPGYAGVWVGNDKIAAIGVAVKRDVSFHGFALNVSTRLEHFEYIVPCGLRDRGVTSLERLLGYAPSLEDVKPKLVAALRRTFADSEPSSPALIGSS